MSLPRNILLWASENKLMRNKIPKLKFVKSAVQKFMPGEKPENALTAASHFDLLGIPSVVTRLGENITKIEEGEEVCNHYLDLVDEIENKKLNIELSLKLTQLGFDISEEETYNRFKLITQKVKDKLGNVIWIDMEGSAYTQNTIDFYKKIKNECENVGLCLQAYLYRTEKDVKDLINIGANIRLVKGAYKESPEIAFAQKKDVDQNYIRLAETLLLAAKENNIRAAFGTHDENIIYALIKWSKQSNIQKDKIEFQMLYGIKKEKQKNLAGRGYAVRVLISYGEYWYPWYMRRLAERPANVLFVLKNMFS
ncbi:MAG: proline dehydrogenase [Ignavibacteria bacterium]|nr:MAG: proline dehydrogenase [Ignavibacteria bacterium]KAF0160688.1 MAG: proline dehydrogenase [Ignavibacteria bacterium]